MVEGGYCLEVLDPFGNAGKTCKTTTSSSSLQLFNIVETHEVDLLQHIQQLALSYHTCRHDHRMAEKRTPVRSNRPSTPACRDPFHPPNIPDIKPDNIELLA